MVGEYNLMSENIVERAKAIKLNEKHWKDLNMEGVQLYTSSEGFSGECELCGKPCYGYWTWNKVEPTAKLQHYEALNWICHRDKCHKSFKIMLIEAIVK
jgi:hypothetical protein